MVWCKWCLFPRDPKCLCDQNPDPEAKFAPFDLLDSIDSVRTWLDHMERHLNEDRDVEKVKRDFEQIQPHILAMDGTLTEVTSPGAYQRRQEIIRKRYEK
jgi:hypothetical protein